MMRSIPETDVYTLQPDTIFRLAGAGDTVISAYLTAIVKFQSNMQRDHWTLIVTIDNSLPIAAQLIVREDGARFLTEETEYELLAIDQPGQNVLQI